MAAYYLFFKYLHVTCVSLTLLSFLTRALWMLYDSPRLQQRWVKSVPHIIDTLLLFSGIILAWMLGHYPFVQTWLTAKLLALLAYIILGAIALKYGRSKKIRVTALIGAVLCFAYLLNTAFSRSAIVTF
jgi:uncharacterized membrane protein SirB2